MLLKNHLNFGGFSFFFLCPSKENDNNFSIKGKIPSIQFNIILKNHYIEFLFYIITSTFKNRNPFQILNTLKELV